MGLRIWLPLNGDLENKGLDNIVIANNGATIDDNGKIGKCYSFDGTNDYINITNANYPNIFAGSFSICFWIYSNTDGSRDVYFGNYGLSGSGNWFNIEKNTNNELRFWWNNGSPNKYFTSYNILNSEGWTHVALTRFENTVKVYKNGTLIESYTVTLSNNVPTTATMFSIGGDSRHSGDLMLGGRMNDFRLYDECLSPMQIKLISQGLVAHYLLNNNGNGNNNLAIGSNTNNINTNQWVLSLQTGGSTRTIELDGNNTNCVKIERDNTAYSGWSFLAYNNIARNQLKPNTEYFISFDCQTSVAGTLTLVGLRYNNATNSMTSTVTQIQTVTKANQWCHMQYSCLTKESFDDIETNSQIIYLGLSNSLKDTGVVLKFKNIKLEEGNKETPWCPNSADSLATQLGYNNNIEYDVSGYCNNGTKHNITDYTSNTPRYSVATKFNGTNSYINVGRGGMVKDEITVNIWGYMDDWTTYNSRLISCTEGGGWNFEASSGKIHFAIGTGSTSNTYKNTSGYTLSELSSGWHMFTGIYDGFTVKQYVDGIFNSSNNAYTTKTPIHYHGSNSILIGAEATGSATSVGGYYFNGNISDVRIYATALSESDIQSLYKNSAFIDSSGNVYSTEYIEE